MGSTRLPGKCLADVAGKPMLARMIARVRHSFLIDKIVVATSDSPADDPIASLARSEGVECFRGSEEDVIGRVLGALKEYEVDVHVELQGDNPLPDPLLLDAMIGVFLRGCDQIDYLSNAIKTTFPPGAEMAVYTAATLRRAAGLIVDDRLREHVGIHIYQRPDVFRLENVEAPSWLRAPEIHLEVDTPEDLELVRLVYGHFLPREVFGLGEILTFVRDAGLAELNQKIERRWRVFREEVRASSP